MILCKCGDKLSKDKRCLVREGSRLLLFVVRVVVKDGEIHMSAKKYEEIAENLVTPITESMGISVYDVEYVKEGSDHYLRIYIDKPGGVNINDCEAVSRAFSEKLDEADPIPDAYIMEVSSPGLGRTLKKDRHFEKSIGEDVDIKLFEAVEGAKEHSGVLKSFDKETVTITTEDGTDKSFSRKGIASTRLKIDF